MSAEPTQYQPGYVAEDGDIFVAFDELVTAISNAFAEPEDFERYGAMLVLLRGKTPEEAGMLMVVLENAYKRAQAALRELVGSNKQQT
jgi:hypothetical protein